MNRYLFLFTITPVQSFLSQARKTRDLFAGSAILSELIKAGIGAFEGEVIFPQLTGDTTYPNRFLGKTSNASEDHGKKVEKAVREKLKNIANVALNHNGFNEFADYRKQIGSYFNYFWIFEEIKNDDYRNAYRSIEKNIGAIKNLRLFEQHVEIGRKCSLTGQHNVLFYKAHANGNIPAFINDSDGRFNKRVNTTNSEYSDFLTESRKLAKKELDYGEGLSAMAYMKRFFKNKSFDSTARIAALNVLEKIENDEIYRQYVNLFENGTSYDEQLLYKENITSAYFEKHGLGSLLSDYYVFFPYSNSNLFSKKSKRDIKEKITSEFKENIAAFEKAHNRVADLIKNKGLHLSSYYALLLFDADNMGVWLSGEECFLENSKVDLAEYHNYLSGLLSAYAKESRKYLDSSYRGKTVYAGGDDFMGFVNLYKLFDVLLILRKTFKENVSDKLKEKYSIKSGKELTFSAGLVVAHYKHPLSDVIAKVKEAEKSAKAVTGKDSISFTILKGSGEITKSSLGWEQGNAINYLEKVITGLENDFSTKFIYSLYDELDIYKNYDFKRRDYSRARKIIYTESKRLISRACQLANKAEKEIAIASLHQALMKLFENCFKQTVDIYGFLDLLQIIDFLKRKAKI